MIYGMVLAKIIALVLAILGVIAISRYLM